MLRNCSIRNGAFFVDFCRLISQISKCVPVKGKVDLT